MVGVWPDELGFPWGWKGSSGLADSVYSEKAKAVSGSHSPSLVGEALCLV